MPERWSAIPDGPLRIYLLGGFRVVVAGRQVEDARWQLRKARSLVKLLALAPTHQLHREQIWDQLWPDMDPEAANNNFHRTLHMARRALDPEPAGSAPPYLQLRGDLLTLAPDAALWIDVEAFASAAAEARSSGDPAAYRAALELYTGELLPEDRYDDWAAAYRDALLQRCITLLGELADLYEDRDEREHAIETLGRLLATDPAHEGAHRALMRLYARGGQRQQALRQYETLRQVLERELGAQPDAESQRLHQEIRDGRFPSAMPAPPSAAGERPAAPPQARNSSPREFGDLLKRLRRGSRLTQEELAERAGFSTSYVSMLERGERVALQSTVDLLAEALELSAEQRDRLHAANRHHASAVAGVPPAFPATPVSSRDVSQPAVPSMPTGVEPAPRVDERGERQRPVGAAEALLTGTVTFFFSDLANSTQLLRQLGEEHYAGALERQRALLRAVFAAHQGHEMDTQGDAFFAAFPTARAGVAAAVAIQRALAAESWPEGAQVRVRIGLHTGVPLAVGDHYVGLDVVRAARIMAAGHGGQVLLSAATHALIEHELPAGTALRDLGVHQLKDLAHPERVYQLVLAELPDDFAPLKTPEAPAVPHHNLPAQLTSFIGRAREVEELTNLLTSTRMLMLAGPGGCGKTRLSLAVASTLVDSYPDGVWFVELAPLGDAGLVPQAVAAALGVLEQAGRSLIETLTEALKTRRLLLVLDNCEHLIVACAMLAETLLRVCPGLRILASSREPLRIGGELIWRVPSLSLPDPSELPDPDELAEYEAIRLFVERARAIRPAFAIGEQNAPAVAQLCHRLDGIPLAIELAAARMSVLSVEQIAARLDDCIALLTSGNRTALDRQQTLRAAMDWSYDLLDEQERALLRRLALFAGGFDLEAAEAVAAGEDIERYQVLDLLAQLVDKSLVVAEQQVEAGEARYRLLEPIRQYDAGKLRAAGELEATQRRHWEWYLSVAQRADGQLRGAHHRTALAQLEREHDNLRAALGWCVRADPAAGLRLASALWQFWLLRGYLVEGVQWLDDLLAAAPEDTPLRGEALLWATAVGVRHGGSLPRMFTLAERSLDIFRAQGDPLGRAYAAYWLAMIGFLYVVDVPRMQTLLAESLAQAEIAKFAPGCASVIHLRAIVTWLSGDYSEAKALLEISLARYRAAEDDPGLCFPLVNPLFSAPGYGSGELARIPIWEETGLIFRRVPPRLAIGYVQASLGTLARVEGDYSRARTWLEEALARFRALEDRQGMAQTLAQLGRVAIAEGEYTKARALLEESYTQRQEVGERRGIALGLTSLGVLAAVEGDYARAHLLLDESLAVVRATSDNPGEMGVLRNLAFLALCEHDYARAQALITEAREGQRHQLARERAFVETTQVVVARLQGDRTAERAFLQETLARHRQRGDRRTSAAALADLGRLDLEDGDHAAARAHFAESLTLARAVDDRGTLARALEGVATLAVAQQPATAIALAGASTASAPARQDALEVILQPARAAVGEAAYALAWAAGQTLSLEQVVAAALAQCQDQQDDAPGQGQPT